MSKKIRFSKRLFEDNSHLLDELMQRELTATQKSYIIMYYKDKKTIRQIADECGVNPSTVSRTISRGTARFCKAVNIYRSIFFSPQAGKRYEKRYEN